MEPKKSLGQHWLHDNDSLEAMCQAVSVGADDTILEIGPGLGTLTELLLEKSKQVVAVEFDRDLADALKKKYEQYSIDIINQDILAFDFSALPADYKIVANIPYYLTSNLVRVISETSNPPKSVALLVQKEVAERAAAVPGKMSILAVTAQFYWQVSTGKVVPAHLFTPPPKVDSQILILQCRQQPLFSDVDTKEFFRLVKAGFSQKRKTLLNSLSAGLSLDKATVKTICDSVEIDPGRRAQTLSLEEWHNLYQSYKT